MPLTSTVSVSQKVQTPTRYEMAEVFLSVSGIEASTTPSEIDDILAQGKIAYSKLVNRLRSRVAEIHDEGFTEQLEDD